MFPKPIFTEDLLFVGYYRKEGNKNYIIVPVLKKLLVGAGKALNNEALCGKW